MMHFFLMNDSSQSEYNTTMINAINIQLQGGMPPKTINLLKEIMDKSKANLKTYIKEWDHKMELEPAIDDLPPAILPVFDDDSEGNDYYKDTPLFELFNMQFTGYSVLSEGFYDLEGRLAINVFEKSMKIFIRCAGLNQTHLNKEFIRYNWDVNNKYVEIFIQMQKEEPLKPWQYLNTSFRFGTGRYSAELPDEHRYIQPKKSELYSILSIQDGVLEISLKIKEDLTSVDSDKETNL